MEKSVIQRLKLRNFRNAYVLSVKVFNALYETDIPAQLRALTAPHHCFRA